ncbi:KxYKxGKxW signal peptide domain-containing protein [Ignavigranum ruoffiae]
MRKERFESFRLTRFKMRKIGNRWIRIGLTRLGFLNIESVDTSDEAVDENHHIVKNALKGALSFGALSGGIFFR